MLETEEEIDDHFIVLNVLDRFNSRTTQMQIGYMSYDEAKSLLDKFKKENDQFKANPNHDHKIELLVDHLIRESEAKVCLNFYFDFFF